MNQRFRFVIKPLGICRNIYNHFIDYSKAHCDTIYINNSKGKFTFFFEHITMTKTNFSIYLLHKKNYDSNRK